MGCSPLLEVTYQHYGLPDEIAAIFGHLIELETARHILEHAPILDCMKLSNRRIVAYGARVFYFESLVQGLAEIFNYTPDGNFLNDITSLVRSFNFFDELDWLKHFDDDLAENLCRNLLLLRRYYNDLVNMAYLYLV